MAPKSLFIKTLSGAYIAINAIRRIEPAAKPNERLVFTDREKPDVCSCRELAKTEIPEFRRYTEDYELVEAELGLRSLAGQ